MAIAQLSAGDPLLMEIVKLARIEEKLEPVLSKMATGQLETASNISYAPLLPPLLWASVALGFNKTPFFNQALDLSFKATDKIPFS